MPTRRPRPVVLIVRDGWGRNPNPEHDEFNAIQPTFLQHADGRLQVEAHHGNHVRDRPGMIDQGIDRLGRQGRQTFGGRFHPKHKGWIYMTLTEGAPGPGLWLSRDNGHTWEPFKDLPFSNIQRTSPW